MHDEELLFLGGEEKGKADRVKEHIRMFLRAGELTVNVSGRTVLANMHLMDEPVAGEQKDIAVTAVAQDQFARPQ